MAPVKKGQKLTDNPRNVRLEIRLTEQENDLLQECAEKKKTTKTGVIVEGIKKVSKELEN